MRRPDIVLILADDLGFSDLGCFGGEIRTPRLDRLAYEGVRMTQFYNTARCSPSRASLLTGKHPHQTGVGVLTRPDLPGGYPGDLGAHVPTLAEILSAAGWRTWLSGKWHLSSETDHPSPSWPTRRGFDRFFGTLAGCSSYFDPQTLTRGERTAADAEHEDFYYTDAISSEAAAWIDEHGASDEPFFLYLSYTAPHWPLHARAEDLASTRGRYDAGWDILRQQRLDRLITEGIVAKTTVLSDRDPTQPAWADAADKEWQASRMEVYAAQVEAMDRGVGKVLDALRHAGRLDNALILFLADNGGCAEELPIGPIESFVQKDAAMLHGTRNGGSVRVGNYPDITPGGEDTYASYGVPWANLSNTPFRRYKRWVHEGGISTPFIARWPQGGVSDGRVIDDPFQLVHIVPTILDATGVESSAFVPEGRSMLPAWQGSAVDSDEPTLFWEHIGNAAVRRGRFKLVRAYPAAWELYDVGIDRMESNDLSSAHPELVTELAAAWYEWAERVGVIPWDRMLERYEDEGRPLIMAEE